MTQLTLRLTETEIARLVWGQVHNFEHQLFQRYWNYCHPHKNLILLVQE